MTSWLATSLRYFNLLVALPLLNLAVLCGWVGVTFALMLRGDLACNKAPPVWVLPRALP